MRHTLPTMTSYTDVGMRHASCAIIIAKTLPSKLVYNRGTSAMNLTVSVAIDPLMDHMNTDPYHSWVASSEARSRTYFVLGTTCYLK